MALFIYYNSRCLSVTSYDPLNWEVKSRYHVSATGPSTRDLRLTGVVMNGYFMLNSA